MNSEQSAVAKYFGDLVAPNRMYTKRLDYFTDRFESLLTYYYPAQLDSRHPFFLIADFLFIAESYVCDENPLSLQNIKEIAENITEGHLELAEKMHLDALSSDIAHYGFDPIANGRLQSEDQKAPYELCEDALNVKMSLGHIALKELHRTHSHDLRVHAGILETQAENFQIWLQSRDAKVFFGRYMALRCHSNNKTERKVKAVKNAL